MRHKRIFPLSNDYGKISSDEDSFMDFHSPDDLPTLHDLGEQGSRKSLVG
jgi:hypothetical protein